MLAGDYNVMPTDLDVYAPERWLDDALSRPEVREAYRCLIAQGSIDAVQALHPDERIYTLWKYFRNAFGRTPVSASIICCSVRPWRSILWQPAWTVRCAAESTRAISIRLD